MADISKLNLDSTNPSSPVYNIKDELARFERISYAQWQQMTPEQQAAKPYYIYDYPSERIINAENVGYDNAESGLAATQVQEAVDEINDGLTNCVKNGDLGVDLGSLNGARIYSQNGDINFRTILNENYDYTSVRTIINNMAFNVWIPAEEFDPLTECSGFYCYSVNPNLKILQGAPNGYSKYATIFGCSGVSYKLLMYVDLFGRFAVWSTYNNEWINYASI